MTISPFTVYLILQADRIMVALITLFAVLAGICLIRRIIPTAARADCSKANEGFWDERLRAAPKWGTSFLFMALAALSGAFVPSTNTLAGCVIAPAIVNSSVVQKDIPELYTLGIEALKQALGKK